MIILSVFFLTGEERIYASSDSIDASDKFGKSDQALTPDFLNTIKVSGLPNHSLHLKIGCPIMLLRNIDPTGGLMNGTRLQITEMYDFVIKAKVITGDKVGRIVLIPRLAITPTDKKLPFKMKRRQLPIAVAFAITIESGAITIRSWHLSTKVCVFSWSIVRGYLKSDIQEGAKDFDCGR